MSREPAQEYLHESFDYVDGKLIWKERPRSHFNTDTGWKIFNTRDADKLAGFHDNSDNYWRIWLNKKQYKRSRLVYIYHYGDIPDDKCIDHINGDRTDDRKENLRPVTHQVNSYNCKKSKNNTSGVTGVYINKYKKKKYTAQGKDSNNNLIQLYYGDDFFEAVCARKSWESRNPHITERHGK